MNFLLDESADLPLAQTLQDLGHDVRSIARDYQSALPDWRVLEIAHDEGRILITNDRDFGELIFRRALPHAGVILFRLGAEDVPIKQAWLTTVLTTHADDLREFIVVTDHGIRVRHRQVRADEAI